MAENRCTQVRKAANTCSALLQFLYLLTYVLTKNTQWCTYVPALLRNSPNPDLHQFGYCARQDLNYAIDSFTAQWSKCPRKSVIYFKGKPSISKH